MPKSNFGRFLSNNGPTKTDEIEFRQRLKNLPANDRFGAFSDRPAVIPDEISHEPDIEEELDSHIPLAVFRRPHEREWYIKKIKTLLSEEKHVEATDILYTKMLVEDRVKPNRFVFNLVLSIHRTYGEVKKAKKLFDMMKSYACPPNDYSYCLLFQACLRSSENDLKLADKIATSVYSKLPKTDLSHPIYSSVLGAFSHTKNLSMTLQVLDDLLIEGRFRPTGYDFQCVLHACGIDSKIGAGIALLVWRRFRQIRGFEFRDFHYTLLLGAILKNGFGNLDTAVNAIACDQDRFDYRSLMTGQTYDGKEVSKMEGTSSLDIRVDMDTFDDKLMLSSPINLISLKHTMPDRQVLLSLLEKSRLAAHRHLSLLGGIDGLMSTMAEDGVTINKFHVSILYSRIPCDDPEIEDRLRNVAGMIDGDVVLRNSYLATRGNPNTFLSKIENLEMEPDVVTFGILSRQANTIPRIQKFFDKLTAANLSVNNVMCLNIYNACGLDFNAKAYILHLMDTHDISPNAKMMETIEKNVHNVRQYVIKMETERRTVSYATAFHIFCIKYCQWLTKVALHPNDTQLLKSMGSKLRVAS